MKKLLFLLLFSVSVVAFGASSYVPPLGWRQYMATNGPGPTTSTNGIIGTNLIDNVGSVINGIGFTNGALTAPQGLTIGTGASVLSLYNGVNEVVAGYAASNWFGRFSSTLFTNESNLTVAQVAAAETAKGTNGLAALAFLATPTAAMVTNVLPAIITNAVNTSGDLKAALTISTPSYSSAAASLNYMTVWDAAKNVTLSTNANFTISGFSNLAANAATNWQYSGFTITNSAASGSITVTLPNGTITPDGLLVYYVTNGTKRIFSLLYDTTTNVCTATHWK